MLLKQLLCSTLCTILVCANSLTLVPAKAEATQTRQDKTETTRRDTEKALALLKEVIEDARRLRLTDNRALVQARAADLLWTYDENRARALFKEATENLIEFANNSVDGDSQDESSEVAFIELRHDLLDKISRRDAQMARAFLHSTRRLTQPDEEALLELKLVTRIAASDPQQALEIARHSLSKGISQGLSDVLSSLQEKNRDAAASLVTDLLTRLRTENLGTNREAATVAFDMLRMSAGPTTAGRETAAPEGLPLVNAEQFRELTYMLASTALRSSPNDTELLLSMPSLMPEVEKYAPALAPRLRRKIALANKASGSSDASSGSEAIEQFNPVRAERGRSVSKGERAIELVGQAQELEKKGDEKAALKLLDEARGLLGSRPRNSEQLNTHLRVAQAYTVLRPGRSFEIIEAMIDQLNDIADATIIVDGFLTQERFAREDELTLKPLFASVSEIIEDSDAGVALLARADFDRTRAIADSLRRPEVRIIGRLFIIQSVLSSK
jgi:hypothetical protein